MTAELLPTEWTPIAWRPRDKAQVLLWSQIDEAPLLLADARRMEAQGHIWMAQKHVSPDRIEVVIRARLTPHKKGFIL